MLTKIASLVKGYNAILQQRRFGVGKTAFSELRKLDDLARRAARDENWPLAETRWRAVVEQLPHHLLALEGVGEALRMQNRLDAAEATYRTLVEKHPHQLNGYMGLARCAAAAVNWPLAETRWRAVVERFPQHALAFRRNIEEIVMLAQQNGQIVHLATFAYYIPSNYDIAKFKAGKLDYHRPRLPVEVWGTAENVSACIETHNRITRDIADKFSNVRLIDIEAAIPTAGYLYDDPCHFSAEGRRRFFDALAVAL